MLRGLVLRVVDVDDVGLAGLGACLDGEAVGDGVDAGLAGVADVLGLGVDGGLVDADRGGLADPALGHDGLVGVGEHAVLVVVHHVGHGVLRGLVLRVVELYGVSGGLGKR